MFRHAVLKDQALKEEEESKYKTAYPDFRRGENDLYDIGLPLLKAAAPYVKGKTCHSLGILFYDSIDYLEYRGLNAPGEPAYNVAPTVRIQYAHPLFPGYLAGIRAGDRLVTLNGKATEDLQAKELEEKLKEALLKGEEVELVCERDYQTQRYRLKGDLIANYDLRFILSDDLVSYSNAQVLYFSKGMLRLARKYQGEPYLVGFEVAQSVLNHFWIRTGRFSLGAVIDVMTLVTTGIPTLGVFGKLGEGMDAKNFIEDADFVSLYLLKTSGFSIEHAPEFWKIMQTKHPEYLRIDLMTFPPTVEERYQALKKSVQKINAEWSVQKHG